MGAEREVRGKPLLVRADANLQIGTGHAMRCLALAQAWQDLGGTVTFAMRAPDAGVRQRLDAEKVTIEEIAGSDDAAATVAIGKRLRAEWIVVDGYGFGAEYQRAIQSGGFPVLFVDDYGHGGEYSAELVLNQTISADPGWYGKRSPQTRLLLGPSYVQLRREFRRRGKLRSMFPQVARNILITLGGADAQNVTALALAAVAQLNRMEVAVQAVVGPANPHGDELRRLAKRLEMAVELTSSVREMAELMEWADVAVSATGGTSSELLFMQVPFVGISVAENQRPTARKLREMGLAMSLDLSQGGTSDDIAGALQKLVPDPQMRSVMARRGRELVDGEGVERVIGAMLEARP